VLQIRDQVLFLTLDRGWGKNLDPDPGSGMNILDHFSESFKITIPPTRTPPFSIKLTPGSTFGVKILQFFNAELDPGFFALDPGSGMKKFGSGYRDKTSQICNNRLYSPLITV
jgi:hypothetical protein